MAVRGLAASSFRWINRLADIARVRAPAMATVIQMKVGQVGQPPAASTIPMYAKGRANIDSQTRIAPRYMGTLVNALAANVVVLMVIGELSNSLAHCNEERIGRN